MANTNIRHTMRLEASPETVLEAVGTDEGIRSWFTPDIDGPVSGGNAATATFKNGVVIKFHVDRGAGSSRTHWKLVDGPGSAKDASATFDIQDLGNGETRVNMEYSGLLENDKAIVTCNTLWGMLLGRLKAYAENSVAAPAFP